MTERGAVRRSAAAVAVAAVIAAPVLLAVTDFHLEAAPAALLVSTVAGALAVSALVLQPVLAARGRLAVHQVLGLVALGLVLVHVGALLVLAPDDALFAMSPDGPTRARMALMATIALLAVVLLGVLRRRLPLDGASWRILHGFLAALVIALGFGHAVITDGALDGPGTVVLLGFGAVALSAIAAAYVARSRRARPARRAR